MAALGVVLVGVGLATWPSTASANNGPHAGSFTLTTSACAGCHRAHTAASPYLVKADSVYDLCTSCHGGLVSTDVVHGTLQGSTNTDGLTPKKLNGGGFVQQPPSSGTTFLPVTSRHKVDGVPINGTPWSGTDTAFGSQNGDGTPTSDAGVGVQGVLECTSCHNPHGSTNYRILNDYDPVNSHGTAASQRWVPNDPDILNFVAYQVLATRDDGPNYGFDLTNTTDCPPNPTVPAGSPTPYVGPNGAGSQCIQRFTSGIIVATPAAARDAAGNFLGMNGFCATCHKSYLTNSGSAQNQNSLNTPVSTVGPGTPTPYPAYNFPGTQDSLDGNGNIARYRHAVERNYTHGPRQPLRYAAIGIDPNPPGAIQYQAFGCEMCHYAHGSSAAQTPAPGDTAPEGPAGDSALLFYDNRGICVSCHQNISGLATLTPTATATP